MALEFYYLKYASFTLKHSCVRCEVSKKLISFGLNNAIEIFLNLIMTCDVSAEKHDCHCLIGVWNFVHTSHRHKTVVDNPLSSTF